MSKALKAVGTVAGLVALAATGVGAIAAVGSGTALLAGSIAGYASIASAALNLGSALLAKPPAARGSVNQITIGANQPTPYLMGRSYSGGNLVYDFAYGGTVGGVPNPYRAMVTVYSLGPIQGFDASLADFTPITFSGTAAQGFYNSWYFRAVQSGATPEAAALAPHFPGAPSWGTSAKISGKAAALRTLRFDKGGNRFASGVPQFGEVLNGVEVYDPRQDGTYPGGSGSCRALQEDTYVGGVAATNPACHALTYALGRYQNGRKVFGIGLPAVGIVLADFVEWSNVCQANGWTIGGTIYEPGDRWENLKNICAAGGAEPVFKGGRLGLRINTPRVALDTIGMADLADGEIAVPGMQSWRDRLNTILPEFRSEAHKWEYVQSSKVTVQSYRDEDGEEKVDTRRYNLVQVSDQSAQLAAYELYDRRERGPIDLPCTYRLRNYPVGAKLTLSPAVAAELGLEDSPDVIILKRTINPANMTVTLTVRTEDNDKHAAALSVTGSSPDVPLIVAPEINDQVASGNTPYTPTGALTMLALSNAYPATSDDDSVTVTAFNATLSDGRANVAFPAGSITGLAPSTAFVLLYDQSAGAYILPAAPALAQLADRDNVLLYGIATSDAGGEYPPEPTAPGGVRGGFGPGGTVIP